MQNVNINDSQTTRIKDLPIIKAPKSSNGKFEKTIIKSFSNFLKSLSKNSPSINSSASEEADSDIKELSDSDKILLSECHKMSFMMEIYLKFITDYEIEENRFLKYSEIDKKNYSNVLVGGQKTSIRNSSQRFFVNETFAGDVNQIKRSLIMPKKFDRVFHLLVDPDDFTVNIDLTPKSTIDKYLSNREIREVSSNDSSVKSYKRIPSRYGEISFDKYFVAIETYNENSVSS